MNMLWKTLVVCLVVMSLPALPAAVSAQADDIATALERIGIAGAQVAVDGDTVTVAYELALASLGPWESFLHQTANIMTIVREHSDHDVAVVLRITYDDGNVIQITGRTDGAVAFHDGQLSFDEYDAMLEFRPVTRGPAITGTVCEPELGDNCATSDACACYPNESCDPDATAANARGCVLISEPANAHLNEAQYICNEGYVWNSDLTACEMPLVCPEGTFAFNGECIAHEQEAEAPVAAPDNQTLGSRSGSGLGTLALICGGGLCLLVPMGVVAVLILRGKRRQRSADQTPHLTPTAPQAEQIGLRSTGALPPVPQATPLQGAVPHATPAPEVAPSPPPPPLPTPFLELERQYADLNKAYVAGQMDRTAFRQALAALVLRDDRGYWSFSPGRWMWFDGSQWVHRDPEAT
ncbi:MAG: hypothetical protein JXC32_00715 [Anaerolineae bacterium]|nr:hypothetical protein [Anaerolineae bacterium]